MTALHSTLRGEWIGRMDQMPGFGNGVELAVTLTGTLGSARKFHAVTVKLVKAGRTRLPGGLFLTNTESAGKVAPHASVQP